MEMTSLLEVVIGMALVYLSASLFVTIVNEYIAQILQRRSAQLFKDLEQLISDPATRQRLAGVPALKPFFDPDARRTEKRSYVDPDVLARMLVGGLGATHMAAETGAATMARIVKAIEGLADATLRAQLLALSQSVKDDVNEFVQRVAQWADKSLTMMGELYKRRTQLISLFVGLVVAIALNVDTVGLAAHLYRDQDARTATSAAALDLVAGMDRDTFTHCIALPAADRRNTQGCAGITTLVEGLRHRDAAFGKLPIGWPRRPPLDPIGATPDSAIQRPGTPGTAVQWALTGLGWILTALAISLGASFWFDLLNRVVNIRHGMRRPTARAEG